MKHIFALILFFVCCSTALAQDYLYSPGSGGGGGPIPFPTCDLTDVNCPTSPCTDVTLNALIATIGASEETILVNQTCTLGADVTVPNNITIAVDKSGEFSIGNTFTLAINGDFKAGVDQVFSLTGTGAVSGLRESYIDWFGALADGSTNNAAAIQAAIDSTSERTFCAGGAGTYNFASQLTNVNATPFICESILLFTGSGEDAFVWGSNITGTDYKKTFNSIIDVRRSAIDYTDVYSGLKLQDITNFRGRLSAHNFYYGINLVSQVATGTAYNEIELGTVRGNAQGLILDSSGVGFVNQNTFYGGDFVTALSTNLAATVSGITFNCSGTYEQNQNVFYNPSLQIHNSNAAGAVAIYSTGAKSVSGNFFFGMRWESASINKGMLGGDGRFNNNSIYIYTLHNANDSTQLVLATHAGSKTILSQNKFESPYMTETSGDHFLVSHISREQLTKSASGVWAPPGYAWYAMETDVINQVTNLAGIDLQSTYLEMPLLGYTMLGIKLDLSQEPRDFMRKAFIQATIDATGGGIVFIAFDNLGARITGSDYVPEGFQYLAAGERYAWAGDIMNPGGDDGRVTFDVSFHPDMETVWLGVTGGNASLSLQELRIYTPSNSRIKTIIDSSGNKNLDSYAISTELPTDTTPSIGQMVLNSEPNIGESTGWVYNGTEWVDAISSTTNVLNEATGEESAFSINYTTNKASGDDIGLHITQTDTASPDLSYLVKANVASSPKFYVRNTGGGFLSASLQTPLIFTTANDVSLGLQLRDFTVADNGIECLVGTDVTNSSGQFNGVSIAPTYNQTGTAAATDLLINRTETAVGSGAQYLIDAQVGGSSKFSVDNSGYAIANLHGQITIEKYGTPCTDALLNSAISSIGATETTLVVPVACALSNNVTIPSNITLKVVKGGSFSIAATRTLTINGDFEAGDDIVFSGLGATTYAFTDVFSGWWGADETAITKTLASLSGNQNVTIASGAYTLTTGFTIAGIDDLNIFGYGAIFTQTAPLTRTFLVNGCDNIKIEGLTLVGLGTDFDPLGQTAADGIYVLSSVNTELRNNHISNFGNAGIELYNNNNTLIVNNRIVGPGSGVISPGENYNFGINLLSSTISTKKLTISNNDISDAGTSVFLGGENESILLTGNTIINTVGQHGVYSDNNDSITMSGNTVDTTVLQGIKLQLTALSPAHNYGIVDGNIVRNSGSHGILASALAGTSYAFINLVISDNNVSGVNAGDGIRTEGGVFNGTIVGNTVYDIAGRGVYAEAFAGSILSNSIQSTTQTGLGVDNSVFNASIDADLNNVIVMGNKLDDVVTTTNAGLSDDLRIGIFIDTLNNATITNNFVRLSESATAEPYAVYSSQNLTGTQVVTNNLFSYDEGRQTYYFDLAENAYFRDNIADGFTISDASFRDDSFVLPYLIPVDINQTTTLNAAAGDEVALQLNYTTNKVAGNDTGLQIDMTDTASPGVSNLIDAQVGGGTQFRVTNTGITYLNQILDNTSSTSMSIDGNFSSGSAGNGLLLNSNWNKANTSGQSNSVAITPNYNQASGTASNTDLLINRTETAVGSGAQYLIDAEVNGTSKFSVDNEGRVSALEFNPTRVLFADEMWGVLGSQWATRTTTGSRSPISGRSNGWFRLTTGATSTDEESIDWNDVAQFVNTAQPNQSFRVQLPSIADIEVDLGFIEVSGASDDDYIRFYFDASAGAAWNLEACTAGTCTTDAGANATTSITKLSWVFTSDTELEWFIDDVSQGSVTTNVPTAYLQPWIAVRTETTSAKSLDVDYDKVWQDRS